MIVGKRESRPLEVYECDSLFTACKVHRLDEVIILSVMTGLRKGVILMLEWLVEGQPDGGVLGDPLRVASGTHPVPDDA